MGTLSEEMDRILAQSGTDELTKVLEEPAAAPAPAAAPTLVDKAKAAGEGAKAAASELAESMGLGQAPAEKSALQLEMDKLAGPERGPMELFGDAVTRATFKAGQIPDAFEASTASLLGDQKKANLIHEAMKLEEEAANLPQKQEEFKEIWHDPSRWLNWAAEIAGDSAPMMGAGLAAGIALTPVGRVVGAGLRVSAPLLSRFAPKAIPYLGGAATVGAMELPGDSQAIYEATGEAHGGTALALSGAKGLVEMGLGVAPALSKLGGSLVSRGAREEAAKAASGGFLREAGKQTGKIMGGEAAEESIQTEMELQTLGELTEGQKNPIDRWGTEAWWQRIEAPVGGAVMGATVGGTAALAQRKLSGTAEPTRESDPGYTSGYSPVEEVARGVRALPQLQAPRPTEIDKALPDVIHPATTDDALDLHLQLKQLSMENGPERAAIAEVLEANTDRYVLVGPDGKRAFPNLYTDTELEQKLSELPQGEQYQTVKVDQKSIDLREMTADVFDLPPAESGKVWFLPETPMEAREAYLQQYQTIQQASEQVVADGGTLRSANVENTSRGFFEQAMRPLLAAGLRVIPSHGRGFWYNGKFQGEAVTPEFAGRSKQIGIYNPTTRQVDLDHRGWLTQASRAGIPVSLDLRRLKPGDVSGVPQRLPLQDWKDLPGWEFRDGVSEATKARLFAELEATAADRLTTDQVHKLMAEGMWYAPSKNLFALVPRPGLDLSAYTYGVSREPPGRKNTSSSSNLETQDGRVKQEKSTLYVEKQPGIMPSPAAEKMQKTMERELRKYLPSIDRLLQKYGIYGGVAISITPFQQTSITTANGEIFFNPEQFVDLASQGHTTGSVELDINNALLHELGHLVTFAVYKRLPLFKKLRLRSAYARALLADRLQADSIGSRVLPEMFSGTPARSRYYRSFAEYLAEQFRRHARADTEIRNEFELPFKEVAAEVKRFYADYERVHGAVAAFNLRSPDHVFGAVMKQLQDSEKKMAPVRRLEQSQELWRLGDGLTFSEVSQEVIATAVAAVESVKQLALPDAAVMLNERFNPGLGPNFDPNAVGRYIQKPGELETSSYWARGENPIALLELAVGALKTKQAYEHTRDAVTQGWMYAYMELGLMSPAEIKTLADGARLAKLDLGSNTLGVIRQKAIELGVDLGWDDAAIKAYAIERTNQLLAAEYVAANLNRFDAPTAVQQILQKIVAVLRALQAKLMETGYHSREQLLHAIFKGEIAGRYQKAAPPVGPSSLSQALAIEGDAETQLDPADFSHVVIPDADLHAFVYQYGGKGYYAKQLVYYFFRGPARDSVEEHSGADFVGFLELKNHAGLGFEVSMVQVTEEFRRQGYATRMHQTWQKELGAEHKPSGTLTPDGYAYWKKKKPHMVRYHVHDKNEDLGTGTWVSPRKVDQLLAVTEQALSTPNLPAGLKLHFQKRLAYYKALRARVSPKAWGDPDLGRMFVAGDAGLNGIQGSITRGGVASDIQKTENIITGSSAPANDPFDAELQKELQWSQAENARVLGIQFEDAAPETMASTPIRQLMTGMPNIPADQRQAMREMAAQHDRIGHFSRRWWGLQQMAWVNSHIPGLRNYVQHADQMGQRVTAWTTRADETARAWQKLPRRQQEALGEVMFWLAEMRYRTPLEVQNNVTRQPTPQELDAELRRRGFTATQELMLERVKGDFDTFLADVERVKTQNLQRTITDPQALAAAIAQLQVEMAQMRSKPYFPFVRFGRHTITVRDSDDKVLWFSAYETISERNKALPQVAAQFPAGSFIQKGMVPEEAAQYMGLPPPLIAHVKATMPDLNAVQLEWLDQFAAAHLPGNSFRRRWLKKTGTPGFSLDAFRAYAHYFTHGSRYLARMEFDPFLREDIAEVSGTTKILSDNRKRVMILEEMQKHHKYISNDPKDFSRLRAFTALFQLGFSVTAAAMNLTQTVTMTSPYLRSTFGTPAIGTWNNTLKMFRRGATTRGLGPVGQAAREEMIRQGRINIGQVSELGSFAEGYNLSRWGAGTKAQRAYRTFSWAGMYGFGKVEQFNRELAFRCAWDLAMKNPDNRKMVQIGLDYTLEIGELTTATAERPAFTHQEAVAFLFARETIDRTQGNYAPWAKPAFLRNRYAGLALQFTQFLQVLIYAFRWNGATVQMLLIFLMLYGLKGGIPGGEDMEEVLKSVGWHFFGKDWDLSKATRKYVRDMTRGTVFDEVGPDLMMHGLSRYGFGVGILPEAWGMPRFDVSANGQIGKVVPGLQDVLRKLRFKSDWDGASSSAMQAIGGAPMGPLFALMQYMSEPPGTTNSHRWEGVLPRAVRDGAKAYRYSTEGETTRQGGRIVKFDWSDPEDAKSLIAAYLGAKPTKVSQEWEMQRAFADSAAIYEARKLNLYGQAFMAYQSKEPAVIKDVVGAIDRYNEDARAAGAPGMQIDGAKLKASIKARATAIAKQEMGIPQKKSQMQLYEQTLDLFPGVKASR